MTKMDSCGSLLLSTAARLHARPRCQGSVTAAVGFKIPVVDTCVSKAAGQGSLIQPLCHPDIKPRDHLETKRFRLGFDNILVKIL